MKIISKIFIIFSVVSGLTACAAVTEILSSTSTTSDAITPDITLNEFVNKRFIAIRQDAANGGGENLDALAQLLGKEDKKAFSDLMKTNFDTIFTDIDTPSEIIVRIKSTATLKNG